MDLISRLEAHERSSTAPRRDALALGVLKHLEGHLAAASGEGRSIRTCETGCGASTVIFSHYAAEHVVYCDDGSEGADLAYTRSHPEFRKDHVSFIAGPTSKTLFARSSLPEIDVLLLNGSHAFPIPEIEYFFLAGCLKSRGLFALSDIRVPTVKRLFDVVLQDERFRLERVIEATAFFICLDQALPARTNDWREQRYNRLSYPALRWNAYSVGFSLPFSIAFEGGQKALPSYFRSGFALDAGRPAMGGRRSIISLLLDRKISGEIEIVLNIEVAESDIEPITSLAVHCAGEISATPIGRSGRHHLTVRARLHEANRVHMTLFSEHANDSDAWSRHGGDQPLPKNFVVTGIEGRLVSQSPHLVQGQRITAIDGAIVRFDVGAEEFRFFVADPHDSIQAYHNVGQIYELDELELISKHVKPGSRILDIGANIGNHAIWFEKSLKADRVVVIEPQAAVISLLKINCLLNDVCRIDQRFLGVALGGMDGRGRIEVDESYNVAGGRLVHDEDGPVRIARGDSLLNNQDFDFVKIDVEGGELDVLTGLTSLLTRCKPTVFVEVWDHGRDEFLRYLDKIDYECVDEFRRYPICSNLLLKPRL